MGLFKDKLEEFKDVPDTAYEEKIREQINALYVQRDDLIIAYKKGIKECDAKVASGLEPPIAWKQRLQELKYKKQSVQIKIDSLWGKIR
jgi:hypothetical protein